MRKPFLVLPDSLASFQCACAIRGWRATFFKLYVLFSGLERKKMLISGLFSASEISSDVPLCCRLFLLGYKNCAKRLLASSRLWVSTGTGPTGMTFGVWVLFWKRVEKFQVSLKSDKKSGYFTWRLMYICDNVSRNAFRNEKCFRQKM